MDHFLNAYQKPDKIHHFNALPPGIGEKVVQDLMAFKASEKKNDPERRQGLHGPYEEATLRKTGRLPGDYYSAGDAEPWGLRLRESRSNILWQVLSGVMDRHPEFGSAYMALALDTALGEDDYAKELRGLNKSWSDYLDHSTFFNDHHHGAMTHTYMRVACPACSMLTALAASDAGMQGIFREMLPMSTAERREFLSQKGLMHLMDRMIPDTKFDLKG